jgi:hypothetical protein
VIEGFYGIDRKGCSQTAVPDTDPGAAIFVHPTGFPAAVFLLECEEGSKVHFIPNSNGRASEDAHSEGQGITFGSNSFLNALAEDRAKGKISFSALDLLEETSHEEEEALRSGVVTGAVGISPVDKDFSNPSESSGEFIATAVSVEEGEDVHADDRVKTQSLVIKICLVKRVA